MAYLAGSFLLNVFLNSMSFFFVLNYYKHCLRVFLSSDLFLLIVFLNFLNRYNLFNLVDYFHSRGLYRSIFLRYLPNSFIDQFWLCIFLVSFITYSPPLIVVHNGSKTFHQHNGRGRVFKTIFSWSNCTGPKLEKSSFSSTSYCSFSWHCRLFHSSRFQVRFLS